MQSEDKDMSCASGKQRKWLSVGVEAHGTVAIGISAHGLIAIGLSAHGVVAIAIIPMGIVSLGVVSMGIFSAGAVSMGLVTRAPVSMGFFNFFGQGIDHDMHQHDMPDMDMEGHKPSHSDAFMASTLRPIESNTSYLAATSTPTVPPIISASYPPQESASSTSVGLAATLIIPLISFGIKGCLNTLRRFVKP
ncbi:MAG TPA: hypothetical protein ACFE0H_09215 [Elainellaceae cyanobacterium]